MSQDGFRHIGTDLVGFCGDIAEDVYELSAKLADDGTPDSDRYLRIRVAYCRASNSCAVKLQIVCPKLNLPNSPYPRDVHCFDTHDMAVMSDLLYGAATVKTVQTLEPIVREYNPPCGSST